MPVQTLKAANRHLSHAEEHGEAQDLLATALGTCVEAKAIREALYVNESAGYSVEASLRSFEAVIALIRKELGALETVRDGSNAGRCWVCFAPTGDGTDRCSKH